MNHRTRPTGMRHILGPKHSARRAHKQLAADLATYANPTELAELAAILGRYDDTETDRIRGLVDWTHAA